jgi:flagellar hook-basal body complex protein FliE
MIAMAQMASVVGGAPTGLTGLTPGVGEPIHSPKTSENPFSDLLSDAVGDVDRLQDQARQAVVGLMTGSGVDVHQAMIATEKASMAFELSLAVRNKAVQAYQQVMSMQF